jgi:uncharacterized protein (TIGR00725 family)
VNITRNKPIVAVFGGNDATALERAKALGAEIASKRLILLTGGIGPKASGVKGAAICGAKDSPWIGVDRTGTVRASEQRSGIVISTDLDNKRNYLEASLCDAAVCLHGGDGTVSEAAFALSLQRPVAFWDDAWVDELPLNGRGHAEALQSMINRTFKRVRETPTGKPRFDALVNRNVLTARLASLPPYVFFATSATASAVLEWITTTLSTTRQGLGGSFPPIEGYDEVIRKYEAWLNRNAA